MNERTSKNLELYQDLMAICGLDADVELLLILIRQEIHDEFLLHDYDFSDAILRGINQYQDTLKAHHKK